MADIAASVLARLKTILSLMEFSSRMKDHYDIYYIASKTKIGSVPRRANYYCTANYIPGAIKMVTIWLRPKNAEI